MEKGLSHGGKVALRGRITLLPKNNVMWNDTGIESTRKNIKATDLDRKGMHIYTEDLREQIPPEVQYSSHPSGVLSNSSIDDNGLQYQTNFFGSDADMLLPGARKTVAYKLPYQRHRGQRRDLASMLNTLILIFGALLTVTTAVKIKVDTPVIVYVPSPEAVLPCNVTYTQEEMKDPVIIRWARDHRDGPSVIWRTSYGRDIPALEYNDSVKFGDGCSLIIKNPNSAHSGVHTVTVDVHFEVSENVELFVFNSTGKPTLPTRTTRVTFTTAGRPDNWITYTIILAFAACGLLIGILTCKTLWFRKLAHPQVNGVSKNNLETLMETPAETDRFVYVDVIDMSGRIHPHK